MVPIVYPNWLQFYLFSFLLIIFLYNYDNYTRRGKTWSLFEVEYLCNRPAKLDNFFCQYRYHRNAAFHKKSARSDENSCLGLVYKKTDFAVLQNTVNTTKIGKICFLINQSQTKSSCPISIIVRGKLHFPSICTKKKNHALWLTRHRDIQLQRGLTFFRAGCIFIHTYCTNGVAKKYIHQNNLSTDLWLY